MGTFAEVGNRHTAERMVRAETDFVDMLMEAGEITRDQATKVLAVYRKARVVKMDAVMGRITVKHGAFWERDVIRRAVEG